MTNPHRQLSDDELIGLVRQVLDEDDPLPPGAIEFASQAFTWRDVNSELAELLHDSLLEAVAVRDAAAVRMLVFQAGEIVLDLEHDVAGLRGAVSPPAAYRVEVQRAVPGSGSGSSPKASRSETVTSDDTGLFEVAGPVGGLVRLAVLDASGRAVLVTPWVSI